MASYSDINIAPDQRGILIGTTRSGKSTLALALLDDLLTRHADLRLLLIDTKARFKASYDGPTGLPSARRYSALRGGASVPGAYRLPVGASGTDLKRLWDIARTTTPKGRGLAVIAQTRLRSQFPWLNYIIEQHFSHASKKHYLTTYVDEMLAFLRGGRSLQVGVVQTICSGGEIGAGFLGASQRPRWIPAEAMTELTKLYLFKMDFLSDVTHLQEMGTPVGFRPPRELHTFHHFDKLSGLDAWLRLSPAVAEKFSK